MPTKKPAKKTTKRSHVTTYEGTLTQSILGSILDEITAMRAELRDGLKLPTEPSAAELTFEGVWRAARQWHYGWVTSIVDSILQPTTRHTRGRLDSAIDVAIDAHLINIAQAQMLLAASDNSGAYDERHDKAAELAKIIGVGYTVDNYTRARCALRADIWKSLDERREEWDHADPAAPEEPSKRVATRDRGRVVDQPKTSDDQET